MFSASFIRDAEAHFWDTFCCEQDANLLGVGFGIGLLKNEVDLRRPYVMRLYVNKKRKRTSKAKLRPKHELPSHMEFTADLPVYRNEDLHGRPIDLPSLQVPTDVCEVGVLSGSGAKTTVSGDPSVVTSGVIVRWRQTSAPNRLRWGVVTVAHGFDVPISRDASADTAIKNPKTNSLFFGKRLMQFNPPLRGFDTVLIEIGVKSLVSQGLIRSPSQRSQRTMSYAGLANCKGAPGTAFQHGREVAFTLIGTAGTLTFRNVGTVQRLIHVKAPGPTAFVNSTSGSVYSVVSPVTKRLVPAAIQIGADERTSFKDGYGQCLRDVLTNLRQQLNVALARQRDRVINQIDLIEVF